MKITRRQLRRIIREAMTSGTLFVERDSYGWVELSDDGGNVWSIEQAIEELAAAGIVVPEGDADPDGVIQAFAKFKNYEIVPADQTTDMWF